MTKKLLGIGVLVIAAAAVGTYFLRGGIGGEHSRAAAPVDVVEPAKLSLLEKEGRSVFQKSCRQCHGEQGAGTENGPPLIHPFYRPNHHADGAFFLAVRNGVRAHHWNFGDMPAQPEVSDSDVSKILVYVRRVQIASGIE